MHSIDLEVIRSGVRAMAPEHPESRGLCSASLDHLRTILISSLPRENVGVQDRKYLKRVSFRAGEDDGVITC